MSSFYAVNFKKTFNELLKRLGRTEGYVFVSKRRKQVTVCQKYAVSFDGFAGHFKNLANARIVEQLIVWGVPDFDKFKSTKDCFRTVATFAVGEGQRLF